jgi:hypothetical protein
MLASSIASDEAGSTAASASSTASMMPMFYDAADAASTDMMQHEVEMQIKGVEARIKGQSEAMMKLLKEMKKKGQNNKKKRKKKKKTEKGSC